MSMPEDPCSSSTNCIASSPSSQQDLGHSHRHLSKNKQRKQRNYEKRLLHRTLKRTKERQSRKEKGLKKKSIGNEEKQVICAKLKSAFNTAPKVVIDCQYDKQMSHKEQSRFAQQLRRAYASNKAAENPLHLIFSSLSEDDEFFKICCQKNEGFAKYVVDRKKESVTQLFDSCLDRLVYLTPDSPNVLSVFDSGKIYIIGGLVDESVQKNVSLEFCKKNEISTARLPIDQYFHGTKKGNLKRILTVNQVFDIILEWVKSHDWDSAIAVGLPQRSGFASASTTKPIKSE